MASQLLSEETVYIRGSILTGRSNTSLSFTKTSTVMLTTTYQLQPKQLNLCNMFGYNNIATFFATLSVLAASTMAAPMEEEALHAQVLEPRITHNGRATWSNVGGNPGESS